MGIEYSINILCDLMKNWMLLCMRSLLKIHRRDIMLCSKFIGNPKKYCRIWYTRHIPFCSICETNTDRLLLRLSTILALCIWQQKVFFWEYVEYSSVFCMQYLYNFLSVLDKESWNIWNVWSESQQSNTMLPHHF